MRHRLTCPQCRKRTMRAWEEEHHVLPLMADGRDGATVWTFEQCDDCGWYRREQTG